MAQEKKLWMQRITDKYKFGDQNPTGPPDTVKTASKWEKSDLEACRVIFTEPDLDGPEKRMLPIFRETHGMHKIPTPPSLKSFVAGPTDHERCGLEYYLVKNRGTLGRVWSSLADLNDKARVATEKWMRNPRGQQLKISANATDTNPDDTVFDWTETPAQFVNDLDDKEDSRSTNIARGARPIAAGGWPMNASQKRSLSDSSDDEGDRPKRARMTADTGMTQTFSTLACETRSRASSDESGTTKASSLVNEALDKKAFAKHVPIEKCTVEFLKCAIRHVLYNLPQQEQEAMSKSVEYRDVEVKLQMHYGDRENNRYRAYDDGGICMRILQEEFKATMVDNHLAILEAKKGFDTDDLEGNVPLISDKRLAQMACEALLARFEATRASRHNQ
ncbi:hypothetical protein CDD81_4018 [Ophiocordyceps australis]|uniref:Uncharacterized protein n=1 Tax=Ophiocordyceps australis TaxID=1399860 RepID=A0A2C5YAM1_9HYPO|nr:hypothetical protein CDD81_4018 [Ophiocordyceps australis]